MHEKDGPHTQQTVSLAQALRNAREKTVDEMGVDERNMEQRPRDYSTGGSKDFGKRE